MNLLLIYLIAYNQVYITKEHYFTNLGTVKHLNLPKIMPLL